MAEETGILDDSVGLSSPKHSGWHAGDNKSKSYPEKEESGFEETAFNRGTLHGHQDLAK